MEIETFKKEIETILAKQILNPKVILDKFGVLDEEGKKSNIYSDFYHLPFYYHAAKFWSCKGLLEIGLNSAFFSSFFLAGSKTIDRCLFFQDQKKERYFPRIAKANIRKVFKGKFDIFVGDFSDQNWDMLLSTRQWDVVLINDRWTYDSYINRLSFIWDHISDNGVVLIQHAETHNPCNRAVEDFSKIVNRKHVFVHTRYGIGVIKK